MKLATTIGAAAVWLLATAAGAQVRLTQNGRLLDANYGIGRSRINSIRQADGTVDGNLLVTGQVSGWYRFRGDVGYYGASQLRLDLPSSQLDDFLSRSAGLPRLATGATYGAGTYLSPTSTVLGPLGIARGLTRPGTSVPKSPYLRSAQVQALISAAVEPYKPIFPEVSRHLRVGEPLSVTGLAGPVRAGAAEARAGYAGPVRPSASPLFGVLGEEARQRLAEQLQEAQRAAEQRRIGEPAESAIEARAVGAEPLPGKPTEQLPQPSAREQAEPQPKAAPPARPEAFTAPTGEDVFVDMLILMKQLRAQRQRGRAVGTAIPGPPLPGETPEEAAERYQRQLDRQAVQRVRDRLVLHGLAGTGKGQFNLHMARAEAMLSEGKYYDAAGEFEVAAVLAPENPLPMLGSALARFAAGEPLTAAFHLRTAFWRFLALMETQVDLDGMLGKKVVDLRLRLIEQRIAQQKDNPQAPLVFLAAFVRHSRGEKDKAAAHARMLKRLAGNDRIYRTFAEYVLTGKVGTGGNISPAGAKAR